MKNLRYAIVLAAALLLLPLCAGAQSICFWTDDADIVPVRIYVDEEYIGDVTASFDNEPLLDTEGTLSVDTTPERHSLTAVDKYGRVYKGWKGTITPREGEIYSLRLRGGQFREVKREDYSYVFLDWVPVFVYTAPIRRIRVPRNISPLTDSGPMVGMAVAAVGATAAMGVAASSNWGEEDARFPYFAIGLGTEYLTNLSSWRNVAQMKARFGNLGGISLLADAGVSLVPYDVTRTGTTGLRRYSRFESAFTFSIGAALDYGGLSFGVRYKPAVGNSLDTFLVARLAYDWWITRGFALDFHVGFGFGGYGNKGLMERYEYPFGMGLLFKL